MVGKRLQVGDVYSVDLGTAKRFFQYVANDQTQLNSDVIRVFKRHYQVEENPDLATIVEDDIDFHAHVFLKFGVKLNAWAKVGNVSHVGTVDVLFRDSSDYGKPEIKVSDNWWIWRVNERQIRVGKLEGVNRRAEIGIVINPKKLVQRLRTGTYDFVYPRYE